jgi:hypothetical protein
VEVGSLIMALERATTQIPFTGSFYLTHEVESG